MHHGGAGIRELLHIIVKLMPNPSEGNPPPFMKGEGANMQPVAISPDPNLHALAHCFKVINDPFRGKLGIFRIHQGRIKPDSQLFIGDARKPFKVNHLFRLNGAEQVEITPYQHIVLKVVESADGVESGPEGPVPQKLLDG